MKPHKETWTAAGQHLIVGQGAPTATFTPLRDDAGEDAFDRTKASWDRARLAAQAPAMARLLLRLQRVEEEGYEPRCAVCEMDQPTKRIDHYAHCDLVAVLRAAGVIA